MAQKDEDRQHLATLDRWKKKIEKAEDNYVAAQDSLKNYLKKAIKSGDSREKLQQEIIEAGKNRSTFHEDQYGSRLAPDELITGLEKFPWEDDE